MSTVRISKALRLLQLFCRWHRSRRLLPLCKGGNRFKIIPGACNCGSRCEFAMCSRNGVTSFETHPAGGRRSRVPRNITSDYTVRLENSPCPPIGVHRYAFSVLVSDLSYRQSIGGRQYERGRIGRSVHWANRGDILTRNTCQILSQIVLRKHTLTSTDM